MPRLLYCRCVSDRSHCFAVFVVSMRARSARLKDATAEGATQQRGRGHTSRRQTVVERRMLGQAMPHLAQLPASGDGHRTGAMHECRPCAASLMRPLTSDGGYVDIGRPRLDRRWSAASSQRALTITTVATSLSDQPRPSTSGLLDTASVSGRSLNADTFEYSGLFSNVPSFISTAQSEHGTSGPGWVSLATHLDTHPELELTKNAVQWLHAPVHAPSSRRNSSSTVKVGLAQIVALVQQGERERKAHHYAAAMLYDLERWTFVNHWVEVGACIQWRTCRAVHAPYRRTLFQCIRQITLIRCNRFGSPWGWCDHWRSVGRAGTKQAHSEVDVGRTSGGNGQTGVQAGAYGELQLYRGFHSRRVHSRRALAPGAPSARASQSLCTEPVHSEQLGCTF